MIFDSIKNRRIYEALSPDFTVAFDFIERASREGLATGTYELDGKRIYAMVQEYETKQPSEARLEAHRKYLDIQYIDKGRERMDLTLLAKATVSEPYDEARDVAFFADAPIPVSAVLTDGEFGIFYPCDVHKPSLSAEDGRTRVRKILVKIEV